MRSRRVTTWVVHRGHPGATAEDYQRRPPRLESVVVRLWRSVPRPPGRSSVGGCGPPPRAPPPAPPPPDRPSWWRAATACSTRSAPAGWARSGGRTTCAPARSSRSRCSAATARRCWPGSCASRPSGCATRTWSRRTAGPPRTTSSCSPWTSWPAARWPTCCDEHGPLDAGTCALLVEQLLLGLAAVHAAGLVHRDVKPANLLLEATGDGPPHLRLGDFGVAAPVADRRFTTVPGAIGTDGYMAPEQARGAPPEPTQDLYAVGRVALELVTGAAARAPGRHPLAPAAPAASSGCWSPTPSSASPRPRRRCDCSAGCRPRRPRGHRCPTGWAAARVDGVRRRVGSGRRLARLGRGRGLAGVVVGCLWVLLGWTP